MRWSLRRCIVSRVSSDKLRSCISRPQHLYPQLSFSITKTSAPINAAVRRRPTHCNGQT